MSRSLQHAAVRTAAAIAVAVVALASQAQESPYAAGPGMYPRFDGKHAEPGVSYGRVSSLPLPKTILYSVTPAELLADADRWSNLGFGAFFVTGVASEWSTDVWGVDGQPWTIGRSDTTWQTLRKATEHCKRIGADTFLTMAFSQNFDWFDDIAWQKIEDNFRQFALFAKTAGCTGLAIDVEYVGKQYHFQWAGYTYDGYTRKDLVARTRARARQIARAIYDTWPEVVLLTLPEQEYTLGFALQTEWVEEAARRKAPGGVHLCVEYTYRRPNIRWMFGHAWKNNRLVQAMLSGPARAYWRDKCSMPEGLWPFGADNSGHGDAPSPAEFRQQFAASLMASPRYNWIYSHDAREAMLGRSDRSYPGQAPVADYLPVVRERQVATNAQYIRVAQDLRRLALRDYTADLALAFVPGMIGPYDELNIDLIPASVWAPGGRAATTDAIWKLGLRGIQGEEVDLHSAFSTQTDWMLIGPFDNTDKRGLAAVYPPEERIDLAAEADGVEGKVRWTEHRGTGGLMGVNLAKQFAKTEAVCAYALSYAHTDRQREVQLRVSGNDLWKLWIGGKLVFESAVEGRVYLDREIIAVRLPAGTTPILLKVCNNRADWGFVFRIADKVGKPVPGVRITPRP